MYALDKELSLSLSFAEDRSLFLESYHFCRWRRHGHTSKLSRFESNFMIKQKNDQIFVIKHKHSAGREGTIRNSNFRSSDSSLWHWPRCPIGIIPLYIPRWIDSLFKLTCLFDLWQCQSVFEEQPFNCHRTVRRIGYCSRSGRGGSLPLIPLLSFVRYLT